MSARTKIGPVPWMDERQLADKVLDRLGQHFHIAREVGGTHWGGSRLRLDAVLKPKDPSGWKGGDSVALGVEFKDPSRLAVDAAGPLQWLAQCQDYTATDWDSYGPLYVFTCPSLSGLLPPDGRWWVERIMGQMGIGELYQHPALGWTFSLHGSQRLWTEKGGTERGKDWSLTRKVGSR